MTHPQRPPITTFFAHQRGLIYALDLPPQRPPEHPPQRPSEHLSERPSEHPSERRLPAGPPTTFHETTPANAPALARAMNQPQSTILERMDQNRRCFVARREGEIASYCWLSLQHEFVGEMETLLDIHPGEAYIWNCATLPLFRRQGLYTALLTFIVNQLADEAITRIWIGADLENLPSHRAFETVGFLPAADLRFFRLWRLFGYFITAPPPTPPHLVIAARRLFRIDRLFSLGPLSFGWRRD